MSGIRLEHISKTFPGGVPAVRDVSLEVKSNELLVLTGPSDCGKSTLLRLIAGLDEISSGEIYIDEQLVNYIDPIERNIAIVYQNLTLHPHLTVWGNLEFGLKFNRNKGKHLRDNIQNTAELLGITNLMDKFPNELDIFERQRVAFAKAAVKSPKVFLVDRVSTDCTEETKKELYEEIVKIWTKLDKTTIVAIDADIMPVDTENRITVMNNGCLKQTGLFGELYNKPSNKFVAGFIGRGRTSFINAKVLEDNNRTVLKIGDSTLHIREDQLCHIKKGEYVGKEVLLALRPEDIKIAKEPGGAGCINARIDAMETLGEEEFIHLTANGINFFVKSPRRLMCNRGEWISAFVDENKLLLFDRETENLI